MNGTYGHLVNEDHFEYYNHLHMCPVQTWQDSAGTLKPLLSHAVLLLGIMWYLQTGGGGSVYPFKSSAVMRA